MEEWREKGIDVGDMWTAWQWTDMDRLFVPHRLNRIGRRGTQKFTL